MQFCLKILVFSKISNLSNSITKIYLLLNTSISSKKLCQDNEMYHLYKVYTSSHFRIKLFFMNNLILYSWNSDLKVLQC